MSTTGAKNQLVEWARMNPYNERKVFTTFATLPGGPRTKYASAPPLKEPPLNQFFLYTCTLTKYLFLLEQQSRACCIYCLRGGVDSCPLIWLCALIVHIRIMSFSTLHWWGPWQKCASQLHCELIKYPYFLL